MRLRKQSMREVADAGMLARTDQRDPREEFDTPVNDDKPRYFRGALVKPKPETKTNGK